MTEELTREQRLDIEVERWKQMDLDARIEDLIQWIKQGYPEVARARINALTRKCTLTDDDLKILSDELCPPRERGGEITTLIQDIRDRYEELGRYAPGQEIP